MNSTYDNIIELFKNINLNNFSHKLIKKNIKLLLNIFKKLEDTYENLPNDFQYKIFNQHDIFKRVVDYSKTVGSHHFTKTIQKYDKVAEFIYGKIKFYYVFDSDIQFKKDFNLIIKLIKITISMQSIFKNDNTTNTDITVIWIPIIKNRDFHYGKINKENLNKSIGNYEGFTVSGITYGLNPRYTVITRYEEIEKLLIHELIHNLYIDGSNFHREILPITKKYIKLKNGLGKKIKNYDYEYSIYESYTELLSSYLFCLYDCIGNSKDKVMEKLIGLIYSEILYGYNTVANLAKLNGYENYDLFMNEQAFLGSICFYEYYYLKALMYNNFLLVLPIFSSQNDYKEEFIKLYESIIDMISNIKNDVLLKDIFNNTVKQTNFKYMLNNWSNDKIIN